MSDEEEADAAGEAMRSFVAFEQHGFDITTWPRELVEMAASRQRSSEWEDCGIYRVAFEDGSVDYVAARRGALQRDLCAFLHAHSGGPCWWHSGHPFGSTLRADAIRSVIEVPLVEMYAKLLEDEESRERGP